MTNQIHWITTHMIFHGDMVFSINKSCWNLKVDWKLERYQENKQACHSLHFGSHFSLVISTKVEQLAFNVSLDCKHFFMFTQLKPNMVTNSIDILPKDWSSQSRVDKIESMYGFWKCWSLRTKKYWQHKIFVSFEFYCQYILHGSHQNMFTRTIKEKHLKYIDQCVSFLFLLWIFSFLHENCFGNVIQTAI